MTHEVTITTSLDRELQPTHYFIVQATKDCLNKPHPNEEFLPNSNSTLRVKVQVEDTNDNAPYFVKDIFTGGMTTDTTFGAVIMKVQVRLLLLQMDNLNSRFHISLIEIYLSEIQNNLCRYYM